MISNEYNLETTKENKNLIVSYPSCSSCLSCSFLNSLPILQENIEQQFFNTLNNLFNQSLHQNQYLYLEKIFCIDQDNNSTNSTESLSFIEISNMHLKLTGSLSLYARKYACIGMFTFMNNAIPKINATKYHIFLNILLEKIRKPEFVNATLLDDIRVKLEKTIVKKLTSEELKKKDF